MQIVRFSYKREVLRMSVIGPEFLDFIKKLEENRDQLTPWTANPLDQPPDFEFNVSIISITVIYKLEYSSVPAIFYLVFLHYYANTLQSYVGSQYSI